MNEASLICFVLAFPIIFGSIGRLFGNYNLTITILFFLIGILLALIGMQLLEYN